MAQQDVRYYLNGTLLETRAARRCARWRPTAIGWRWRRRSCSEAVSAQQQVIVPRKGVLELQRILGGEGELELRLAPITFAPRSAIFASLRS